MLKTVNRLKKEADFALTLSTGKRQKVGPLLFFTIENSQPIRIGIVVSKKVDKKAVVRNHLRRLISHELSSAIDGRNLSGDVVIVVLFSNPQIVEQIKKAIEQWARSL